MNSIWTFPCLLLRATGPSSEGQERNISVHGWEGKSLSCLSSAFTPLKSPTSSRWAAGPRPTAFRPAQASPIISVSFHSLSYLLSVRNIDKCLENQEPIESQGHFYKNINALGSIATGRAVKATFNPPCHLVRSMFLLCLTNQKTEAQKDAGEQTASQGGARVPGLTAPLCSPSLQSQHLSK